MEVTLALLADAANVSQEGKLNVLGVFNNINTSVFPAQHPMMQLVLRFEASLAEAGMKKKLVVRVLDEDGGDIGEITGELTLPEKPEGKIRRLQLQGIIPVPGAVFPKPGQYVFAVLVDGNTATETNLTVTQK